MSAEHARIYHALLRTDFAVFVERCFREVNPGTEFLPGWHIDLIASELAQLRTRSRQLVINVPPRHLKSLIGSVALPAWLLGLNPSVQIICASYGAELAGKLARDCRAVMTSSWYRGLFPGTQLVRNAVHELTTTRHGARVATSVDGPLTGRGANLIIIDDPLKPDEALSDTTRNRVNEWFDGTLYSRLNDKRTGSIVLIMQRLHEDDLTGHLLARGGWDKLILPAIADEDESYEIPTLNGVRQVGRQEGEALQPARESLGTLAKLRTTIGEYNFAGQYQQSPAPQEGGHVKRAWFQSYRRADLPARFEMILQSWDTANKATDLSDFSVCTTWGLFKKHSYLLHVFRKKLDYPSLKRAVREQADVHDATVVLIEDKASGTQLIQELSQDGMYNIKKYTPRSDWNKEMRLIAQTGAIENGQVHLPEAAEWLDTYLHEMTTFPASKHDDQVDSTSQALHWITTHNKKSGIFLYYERQVEELQGRR